MARPKKNPSDKQSVRLSCMVTPKEARTIRAGYLRSNEGSLSDWLRKLALEAAKIRDE